MTAPRLISRVDFTTVRVESLPADEDRAPGWHHIRVTCGCASTDTTSPQGCIWPPPGRG